MSGDVPADSPVSRSVIETVVDPDAVVEEIEVSEGPIALRPVAGGRHEARERAVHLLYESELKSRSASDVLGSQVIASDPFTAVLVNGVAETQAELDDLIGSLARGWTLQRMPRLDLVILRVACYELAYCQDIPTGAVLSEAVDLAGRYGTDDSSRFVNGLLANAARQLRPDDLPPG